VSAAIAASIARQLLERGLTLRDVAELLRAHPRAVRALLAA
jgi:predicted transcriptional regulator